MENAKNLKNKLVEMSVNFEFKDLINLKENLKVSENAFNELLEMLESPDGIYKLKDDKDDKLMKAWYEDDEEIEWLHIQSEDEFGPGLAIPATIDVVGWWEKHII